MVRRHCRRCHDCGTELKQVLDGEEWCPVCGKYRRYYSHGWSWCCCNSDEKAENCPDWETIDRAINEKILVVTQ